MGRKRFAVAVATVMAILLGFSGVASAQDDDDADRDDARGWTVSTFSEGPINFSIVAGTGPDQCPNLPAGVTVVSGVAVIDHVVRTRTDRKGITHVVDTAEANGAATDNNGDTYSYAYDNVVRAKNSLADPATGEGTMKDAFRLKSGHRTVLHNGFLAHGFFGPGAPGGLGFYLDPIREFGDPFNFPTGPGRCDPI